MMQEQLLIGLSPLACFSGRLAVEQVYVGARGKSHAFYTANDYLYKALDASLPGLMLQSQLPICPALLYQPQPLLPKAMFGVQVMKFDCSCLAALISLLLSCLLLLLKALMFCMLCCAVPGLHDTMLSEEHMEGESNILQMCLPGLLLCMTDGLACGNNITPSLQQPLDFQQCLVIMR